MKPTSNERPHPNIKSGISQQPMIGSSSNFKLKLKGLNQNGRRPPMEGSWNFEFLSKENKMI